MRQLKIATQITNRDSQAVEKYLQEISKISMITPEEETILAQKIKMGDQRALDKLVQANLRFVVSVAKQYQHQGLSLSDLINEGNLGLIKAAQRFDETKGFKFISYAVWWIRQSILQALAEQGRLVRLPQNKIGTYNKANKAYMAFEQEHEREPSTEELAELLEMSETEINNILNSIAFKLNVSASQVASFLNEGNSSKTATEIINERTKSDTFISSEIKLNEHSINEILRIICYYYNHNPVKILFKSEDQSPFLDKLKTYSDVFSSGNISPERFVKDVYKNLSQEEQQKEIDFLTNTKEQNNQLTQANIQSWTKK